MQSVGENPSSDQLPAVEADASARAHRRRWVLEALEFERSRESSLRDRVEEVSAELEGPRIDAEVFARISAEDAEVIRAAFGEDAGPPELGYEEEVARALEDDDEVDPKAQRRELLEELARLRGEIDDSRRRQRAFEHYMDALWTNKEASMAALTPDVRKVIEGKSFWHVATVNPNGSPQVSPVWAHLRDDKILINSIEGRKKPRNLKHEPRVSLAWHDPENPYHSILIKGRVVETITDEQADSDIDMLSEKYLGQTPYPYRTPGERRVTFLIEPDHVMVNE
jgi:PPOX class probable F420-dependent enzyme